MRFKILVAVGVTLVSGTCLAQDINRSGEWAIKRAEQTQAQREAEMKQNGVYAPKGKVAMIVDSEGNATSRRKAANQEISEDTEQEVDATKESVMAATTKNEFSAASEALVTEAPPEQKPFQVLFILAAITAAIVIGFRLMARKIVIPDGALERQ